MAVGKSVKKKKEEAPEAPVTVAKKPVEKAAPKPEASGRGIVRIAGKDMKGHLTLKRGLLKVRGISHAIAGIAATIVNKELGIAPTAKVGDFSDDQIEKIDKVLYSLHTYDIPKYMMNRRKDALTGEDQHIIMNDLIFATTQDIEREKKSYTWKGYRHAYSQKVRGQRTRNTGRQGMAVGVLRKAIMAAQQKPGAAPGAAAPAAAKEEKKAAPAAKAAAPAAKK